MAHITLINGPEQQQGNRQAACRKVWGQRKTSQKLQRNQACLTDSRPEPLLLHLSGDTGSDNF